MPLEPKELITSRQNSLCKLVRSLHSGKGRDENGLFVAEGANAVEAALASGWEVELLLTASDEPMSRLSELALKPRVAIQQVTPEILGYISDAGTLPDWIALVRTPASMAIDEVAKISGLTVVLDGVADAGNVGTLVRSVDAVGAARVCLTTGSADAFGPKAVRSSAGSIFHVPITQRQTPGSLAASLKQRGMPIIAAVALGGIDCFEFAWPRDCALVLGHETRGISAELEAAATAKVTIPMHGNAESLNVAMAGTVLMFAWRQATL